MLIDIDTGKEITKMPFGADFERFRKRLSTEEFDAIVLKVNELVDAAGADIATAGWLPGRDWTGTVFDPIYSKAARMDYHTAALFFGLIVWYTIMHRPERWGSGRYEKDGRDIGSRTYFRLGA